MEFEIVDGLSLGAADDKEREVQFQRIPGVMYCKSCGREHFESEILKNGKICPFCKNQGFITGEFAAALAGYIRLDKLGKLKEYYKTRTRKTSGARMNTKRMIIWLLVKDGFMVPGDRKTEDIVYRTLWKTF